jgi:hypothetical protein
MDCDHCEICREEHKCVDGHHICMQADAIKDMKPQKWEPEERI